MKFVKFHSEGGVSVTIIAVNVQHIVKKAVIFNDFKISFIRLSNFMYEALALYVFHVVACVCVFHNSL